MLLSTTDNNRTWGILQCTSEIYSNPINMETSHISVPEMTWGEATSVNPTVHKCETNPPTRIHTNVNTSRDREWVMSTSPVALHPVWQYVLSGVHVQQCPPVPRDMTSYVMQTLGSTPGQNKRPCCCVCFTSLNALRYYGSIGGGFNGILDVSRLKVESWRWWQKKWKVTVWKIQKENRRS